MATALQDFLGTLGFEAEVIESLTGISRLVPEQILSSHVGSAHAALIDPFGRLHRLRRSTAIGREPKAAGIMVLDGSVSRRHAELYEQDGGWWLKDLESTNGTVVNDVPVEAPTQLSSGDMVHFGQVGFLFLSSDQPIPEVKNLDRRAVETFPASASAAGLVAAETAAEEDEREDTFVGLPVLPLSLVSPTGGGGGLLNFGSVEIQLTVTQFELLSLLNQRMAEEADQPASVRGFVRSSELLSLISWDTAHPDENHLKQLVRRVRRTLARASVDNLIESRRGFGYRLRTTPVSE